MIKIVLKHALFERCIDTIFSKLTTEFAKPINVISVMGCDITQLHVGMKVVAIKKVTPEDINNLWMVNNIRSQHNIRIGARYDLDCRMILVTGNLNFHIDNVYADVIYFLTNDNS